MIQKKTTWKRGWDALSALRLSFTTAAVAPLIAASGMAEEAKPNIVFIMVDDTGWADLGVYGGEAIQTPNLDRMAEQGIRFTEAYSGSPLCAPARSSVLTGLHTGRTPVRGNLGGTPLPADAVTFGDVMQQAGYKVGGFGKWGVGDVGTTGVPEKHGFDEFFGYYHQVHAHTYYPSFLIRNSERVDLPGNVGFNPRGAQAISHRPRNGREPQYTHYEIFDRTLEFIRENQKGPFLCYAPWTPPHFPFQIPDHDPAWQLYKDKDWPIGARNFAAMTSMVDRHVGELLELLEELGIAENTIVMFTSDNGAASRWEGSLDSSGPLRGQKMTLWEGGIRVPFIAYWPGRIEPGQVSDLLTYFPDMMPTFAELGGATDYLPEDLDGLSIVPTLLGAEAAGREQETRAFLYFENATNDYPNQRYLWPETLTQAARIDHWKAYRENPEAETELYDLNRDIGEENNLASDHPELVARFESIFERESRHLVVNPDFNPRTSLDWE